jgi:hypothetical protein
MKQLLMRKLDRIFLLKATLLAAMVVPALPVCAQQEVDPAWYDPWKIQTKVVVQPAKLRTHKRELRQSTTPVSLRTLSKTTRVRLLGVQRKAVLVAGRSQVK